MLGKRQEGSGPDQQQGQDFSGSSSQAQAAEPKKEQSSGGDTPFTSPESEPDDLPF